ncbi:hypothetical protein KXX35_008580 [Aspergillus fumigatus]|nr:hypothetical protein KXX63_000767 [Aspergillus fumigatus]KAH1382667.1 hypothetical protein KXX49_005701 [Aspergillus fumigatus]KAH1807591.1 hypothetical protein KXX35_008580 [Aspergillus fumigatus]KAH1866421.1 hypothetical protein KXX01_001117 [Aspergillus fumigatus]KAH1914585.1 hypothetical protein KXW47_004136 [Aspergillus fumigatus]
MRHEQKAYTASEREIDLIREISWHRGRNRFYRACYQLLKELQEVVSEVTDVLLGLYHFTPSPFAQIDYSPVTDIAFRMQEILRTLSDRESEALNAWNDLWTTEGEFDVKHKRADV